MKKLFSGVSVGALALSAVVVPATAFGADAGKQDLSVLEHRYQVNCVDDNIIGPAQCKALEAEIAKLKAPAKKPVKPAEEKKDVCEGIKPGDTGYNSCELKKKKTEEALVKAEREKMAKLIMDKIADKALADKVLAGQITIFDAQKQLNSYLTRGKVAVAKGTNDAEVKEALALKAEALGKNFLAKQIRASKKSSVANLLAMLNSALKPGERVQLSDVDARVKPAGTTANPTTPTVDPNKKPDAANTPADKKSDADKKSAKDKKTVAEKAAKNKKGKLPKTGIGVALVLGLGGAAAGAGTFLRRRAH